jgi:hypothetical protein
MNRSLQILLLIFATTSVAGAQDFLSWQLNDRYFSVQVGTGTSTYFGDLKHNNNINKSLSIFNIGVEARLLSRVSARFQVSHYQINGGDYQAKDSTLEQQRNLSFYSKNWEVNLNSVFYLKAYKGDYFKRLKIEPYAVLGIGVTHFNPKADVSGVAFDLHALQTEGVDYNRYALIIPAGLGLKFKVNTFMNFNIESTYRFTFSDYLDDVSGNYAASYPDFTTALVANRKDEVGLVNEDAYNNILIPGGKRGDDHKFDGYLFLNFQLEFYLPPDLFQKEKKLFK